MEHLQRVWLASRERLPFRTPGSVPILGLANAPIVETKFLELAMSLLDFSHRIPLGTFSILLFSKFFQICRDCRQGDPVSPYIFNLCVEIMGMMIRQNKNIRGIRIGGEEICLLQYADDTVIFLDGTEKSLKSALDLLFQFSKYSGLKPNYDKTRAIWIGSKINSKDTMYNESGINWTNDR